MASIEVPEEILCMVEPLGKRGNWEVLIAVLERDQECVNSLELRREFDNSIEEQLEALIMAGLIERRSEYIRDIGDEDKAYYYATQTGKALVRALFKVYCGEFRDDD